MRKTLYSLFYRMLLATARRRGLVARVSHDVLMAVYQRLPRREETLITAPFRSLDLIMPADCLRPIYYVKNPRQEKPWYRLAAQCDAHYGAHLTVDVGANIGDTVLIVAKSGLPANRYLCVEGDACFSVLLDKNIAREGLGDLIALRRCYCGEGDDVGKSLRVERSYGTAAVHFGATGSSSSDVPIVPLDEVIAADKPGLPWRLLKIDTDGFDFRVLRGGRQALRRHQPVLFFELSPSQLKAQGENCERVAALLTGLGYHFYLLYSNHGELFAQGTLDAPDALLQAIRYSSTYGRLHFDLAAFPKEGVEVFNAMLAERD